MTLIVGLQNNKLKASEVFDIEKLTMYVALSNLFGGYHGLNGHNLKIYFNPITNMFEPISWDSDSGHKIEKIYDYRFAWDDPVYSEKLIEKLALVSSTEFLNNLFNRFGNELNELSNLLKNEYDDNLFDFSVLEYNSNFIKIKFIQKTLLSLGL